MDYKDGDKYKSCKMSFFSEELKTYMLWRYKRFLYSTVLFLRFYRPRLEYEDQVCNGNVLCKFSNNSNTQDYI